jgi:hypothetical protein
MSAPQKQRARPSADCVGIFMPASRGPALGWQSHVDLEGLA